MLNHEAHGGPIKQGRGDDPGPLLGGDADDRLIDAGEALRWPVGSGLLLSPGGHLGGFSSGHVEGTLHVHALRLLRQGFLPAVHL